MKRFERCAVALVVFVLVSCGAGGGSAGGAGGGSAGGAGGSAGAGGGSAGGGSAGGAGGGSAGGAGGSAGAGGGSAGGSGPDAGLIVGSRFNVYRLEGSDVFVPDDSPVSALVATDSGFITLPGTLTGDGGFQISGVPEGEYYLRLGEVYLATRARTHHLTDHNYLGRPNTPQAPNGVPFTANMAGLSATTSPRIRFASPNTGTFAALSFDFAPFANTEMAVTNEPGKVSSILGGLPTGRASDNTYFWQLVDRDAGPQLTDAGSTFVYTSSAAAAAVAALSISPDGGPLNVVFSPAARTVSSVIKQADFAAWTTAVHPQTQPGEFTLYVFPSPNPAGVLKSWSGYSGILLQYTQLPTGTADLPLTLELHSPFPASWSHIYQYLWSTRSVRLAGSPNGGVFAPMIEQRLQPMPIVAPQISPPRALQFDSASATTQGTFASLTPVIRWMAPMLGSPALYLVDIFVVTANGTSTDVDFRAELSTQGTQLRVPPGVLVPGATHVIRVAAYSTPSIDLRLNPLEVHAAAEKSTAAALSSVWTAP